VFFMMPLLPMIGIYIIAAVLPAIILLRYVYRHDRVEKEPAGLLVSLILLGIFAALCSGLLEQIGQTALNLLVDPESPGYTLLLAFVVVAMVEEGMKFWLLKKRTWYHPAFNYRFDGIVYAVFVSLGFAAYENVLYVLQYGLSVALPRALLAVPGHMSFAVCMGIFYGHAKCRWERGDDVGTWVNLGIGYVGAVALHGFYDACAMIGTSLSTGLFVVFVIFMFLMVYHLLKRESATDTPTY